MKKLAWVFTLGLSMFAAGRDAPQYPLTLTVHDREVTQMALQASPVSANCTTNCYSGELECHSKDARYFQLAAASDGATYELRCEASLFHNDCPIAAGSYQARRERDALFVRLGNGKKPHSERKLTILRSSAGGEQGANSASAAGPAAASARLISVIHNGDDEVGMKFAYALRRAFSGSAGYRVGNSDEKGWVVKIASQPVSSGAASRAAVSVVVYLADRQAAQPPIAHTVYTADLSDYEQAATRAFQELDPTIKKHCRAQRTR